MITKIICLILVAIFVSVAIINFAFIASMLVPVKFTLRSLPKEKEFYIIAFMPEDKKFYVVGDSNGFFGEDEWKKHIARANNSMNAPGFSRFGFEDAVSIDLYEHDLPTYFIVYGTAIINDEWNEYYWGDTSSYVRYTIDTTGWDIYGNISTSNGVRALFPKGYLNIWDLRWFDILRDRWFFYLDGATYF